jgi:hypothetical protein
MCAHAFVPQQMARMDKEKDRGIETHHSLSVISGFFANHQPFWRAQAYISTARPTCRRGAPRAGFPPEALTAARRALCRPISPTRCKDERTVDLRDRPLCDRAVVLNIADRLSHRHRRRRRHRPDQFDRQSRRICRPYAMGYLKDATGGFTAAFAGGVFPALICHPRADPWHNPALERSAIPEAAH